MHFFWLAIVLISSCFCPSLSSYLPQTPNTAFSNGFSVDLIHRDSPLSPYYNPAATQSERWRAAARHSISRLRCSHRTKTNPRANDCGLVTTVTEFGGAYLIPLTFGTPPRRFLLNADTGSDLIWIQCTDCKHCFPQDVPLFEPSKSSTYLYIPCDAPVCRSQYVYVCDTSRGNLCGYYYRYRGVEVCKIQ